DDFPENGPDGIRRERAFICLQNVSQDFLFPSRGEDFRALIVFELPDFRGMGSALIYQFENLDIEPIDLRAKTAESGFRPLGGHGVAALEFARHKSSGPKS